MYRVWVQDKDLEIPTYYSSFKKLELEVLQEFRFYYSKKYNFLKCVLYKN